MEERVQLPLHPGERLNWLSEQAHDEYYREVCRAYITLPRILTKKNGVTATTLRRLSTSFVSLGGRDFQGAFP
jgi:hypothetical protein